ncbi:MAG: TolC family protein [Lentimicrobiaceae bacterium]|jgi:outer membrane protein|nr:TolC family protein [Lentimicrobiaceae bacterium]
MNRFLSIKQLLKMTLTTFVFLMLTGSILAQKIWKLEDCIHHAHENNISVQQSYLNVETAKVNQLESKLSLLPSLSSSISHSFGWGRSIDLATYEYTDKQTQQSYFDIGSSITLFNGFQKINTMKLRRYEYLASRYDTDKIKNDISIAVASAYLQILFSEELVNNAQNQVEVTLQQVARTQKLYEVGTLAQGSVLEIQAQLATEEVTLVQAENQRNIAVLDLLQLLELEAGTTIELERPALTILQEPELQPIDYIYNTALAVMPEIKSAEMNLEGALRSLAIARGNRSPSISMRSGFGTNYSDQITDLETGRLKSFDEQIRDNHSITLSFSMNIPIFNGYQVGSYIQRSKLNRINADYNLQKTKNALRKSIETAYADALAAYKTYVARQKSLKNLQESFKYTEHRFNVGMVNALDYNVAKNQMNRAESDVLSAKFDYLFKLKILDFYLDKPLTLSDLK